MMAFVITIHVFSCILLIILILIQRGHGGGLVEAFSGVDSMFGPKTNAFLTRITTVLSIVFFVTCLTLAFLSARQSRSLMKNIKVPATQTPAKQPGAEPATQATAQQSPVTQGAQTPTPASTPQEAPKTK